MAVQDRSSLLSSPDPLGISPAEASSLPCKTKRGSSITPRKALTDSDSNRVRLQDFYLTTPPAAQGHLFSPTKSNAQTENLLSPWRIRVTVEAEREDDENDGNRVQEVDNLPIKRLAERTTTTTVPLKDADVSSPAQKRGRGRPRKSLDSGVKRAGTPKPTKNGRKKIQPEGVDDGFEEGLAIVQTPPKKARGRPRKSIGSDVERTPLHFASQTRPEIMRTSGAITQSTISEPTTRRRSKGRRKAMTPLKIVTDSDASPLDEIALPLSEDHLQAKPAVDSRQSRSIQARRLLSPRMMDDSHYLKNPTSAHDSGLSPVTYSPAEGPQRLEVQNDHEHFASIVQTEAQGYGEEIFGDHEDQDPTCKHREFDSILESEGFSMVSVSSLSSARQTVGTTPALELRTGAGHSGTRNFSGESKTESPQSQTMAVGRAVAETSMSHATISLSKEGSVPQQNQYQNRFTVHNMGSPPMMPGQTPESQRLGCERTPSKQYSSPSLPPPMQAVLTNAFNRSLNQPTGGTPKLARVVRAGIALQGVLSPERHNLHSTNAQNAKSSSPSAKSPKERLDDLFGGFGAGTRRELRAGLRLGEELAKRQQVAAKAAATLGKSQDDVFREDDAAMYPRLPTPDEKESYNLTVPSTQRQVEYPVLSQNQLPSPGRSEVEMDDDRMSWKADTPERTEPSIHKEFKNPASSEDINYEFDETMLAREADWKREREAVSRQIQMANESQVIVIDSDESNEGNSYDHRNGEYAGDEGEDIWQAEAYSSDFDREPSPKAREAPDVLFSDEVVKPRRSKLPSPWRRHSQVVYSDEAARNEEDLFWQPGPQKSRTADTYADRIKLRTEVSQFSVLSELVDTAVDSRDIDGQPAVLRNAQSSEESAEEEVVEGNFSVAEDEDSDSGQEFSDDLSDKHNYSEQIKHEFHNFTEQDQPENAEESHPNKSNHNHPPPASTKQPTRPDSSPPQQPRQPPSSAPTSWLTRLTSLVIPIWPTSAPAPTTTIHSSKTSQDTPSYLSLYTPWNITHYRALHKIYTAARADHSLCPYNPHSASAWLLDYPMRGSGADSGWAKDMEAWEVGVVEAFVEMLDREGVDDREVYGSGDGDGDGDREVGTVRGVVEYAEDKERKVICEAHVAKRVFSLWIGAVERGQGPVGKGKVGAFLDERFRGNEEGARRQERERERKRS
ncbi:hypothetical protein MMC24_000652 [Lignoscripta atroalba]|nr:hypothetical protein [Lignoscripta atroalba]